MKTYFQIGVGKAGFLKLGNNNKVKRKFYLLKNVKNEFIYHHEYQN